MKKPCRKANRQATNFKPNTGRWSKTEHAAFLQGMERFPKKWKRIAALVCTRTVLQVRTHAQKWFLSNKMEGNHNTHKKKWFIESDYLDPDQGKDQKMQPFRTVGLQANSVVHGANSSFVPIDTERARMSTPRTAITRLAPATSVDLPLNRTASSSASISPQISETMSVSRRCLKTSFTNQTCLATLSNAADFCKKDGTSHRPAADTSASSAEAAAALVSLATFS